MVAVFLMRVALPDRPGALGAVASAVGTVGADIRSVEIVGKTDGEAVDDFVLTLPNGAMPDNLVSACTAIAGVRVLWFSRYPEGGGLESDIEALERMQQSPGQAPEVLTESAPVVFHCHWAVLLDTSTREATFSTSMAPDLTAEAIDRLDPVDQTHSVDLEADWLPSWGETTVAMAPVDATRTLVLGRQGGPEFMASEVARLKHLAGLAAG